jgi:6-phosphofructokinase 1
MLGIRYGFDGLIEPEGILPLNYDNVSGILQRGGTILGAANRGNPFARRVEVDGEDKIVDVSDQVIARITELGIDALIVVGGDGTLAIGRDLYNKGVPVIGVPKTIDNDVGGTEVTFGFDTAVGIATEAIDRLHTTAEAHHRVMVLEVMGRDAGFIALHSGLAGGADIILIPELPFRYEAICQKIEHRKSTGRKFSIIVVSEGAHAAGEQKIFSRTGDEIYVPRLGGIGNAVGAYTEEVCGSESRVTVLGHIQRGGIPSAFDRWLATRYGAHAVRVAAEGRFGSMVSLHHNQVVDIPLDEALKVPKRVDLAGDAVQTARDLGIIFAD